MDGVDALGRPVVVINADAVPHNMKSSALVYCKMHLEPVVNKVRAGGVRVGRSGWGAGLGLGLSCNCSAGGRICQLGFVWHVVPMLHGHVLCGENICAQGGQALRVGYFWEGLFESCGGGHFLAGPCQFGG